MANLDEILELVTPIATDLGAEVYDIEFVGGLLRLTLDRPGGIDLDTLTQANRQISRAFDLSEPIPGRYTLEVTSPGLERNLRTAAHFARSVGDKVRLKTRRAAEVDGERRVEGVVAAVDGDKITLEVTDGTTRVLRVSDIDRARTVFEWGPAPKPGHGPTGATGTTRGGGAAKRGAATVATPAGNEGPTMSESEAS